MTDIDNKNPASMTPTIFRRLKARYEVDSILVAVAHVNLADQKFIQVELFDASSGVLSPFVSFDEDPKLIASSTLLKVEDFIKPKPVTPLTAEDKTLPPQEGKVLESEIDPSPFDPMQGRTTRSDAGRDRMISMAQDRSKELRRERENNIIKQREQELNADLPEEEQSVSGEISVSIFFNSMSEWIATQKEISRLNGLEGIRIVTLKTNQADTVVEYSDWNKLSQSLKSSGYILDPQSPNAYILKRLSDNF